MEEWRTIEGYSNYRVSNEGRIKSLNYNKTKVERILKPHKLKNGYLGILLFNDDKKKHDLLIHRLVAQAFIPNPNNYNMVNHKDEVRSNNNVDNLEWCDSTYNNNYGDRNARLSRTLTNHPFFSIPVLQYSKDKEFIQEFPSMKEAARAMNCSNIKAASINIAKCCRKTAETQNGRVNRKTAYGYIWEFKNN